MTDIKSDSKLNILSRNTDINKHKENTSLFIFRRDFRLYDNTALYRCFKESKTVYPIFIFTPEQVTNKNEFKSSNAIQFMITSLQDLHTFQKLQELTLFQGNYIDVLKQIINNNPQISAIYTNTDYTPYAIKRDIDINNLCKS